MEEDYTVTVPSELVQERETIAKRLDDYEISNVSTYIGAGELILEGKRIEKELEDLYEDVCSKAYKRHRMLTKQRKNIAIELHGAIQRVSDRVIAWERESAQRQTELQEKVTEQFGAEDAALIDVPSEAPQMPGLHVKKKLVPVVTDIRQFAAAILEKKSGLPDNLLSVDLVLLGKFVNAIGEEAARRIPGVTISTASAVQRRARR